MSISTDYTSPIIVNGFSCNNCTDVSRAQKNIDPANPTASAFGVSADKDAKAKEHKQVFDRDRIDAAVAARQADASSEAKANASRYASPDLIPASGQFVNLSA